MSFLNVDKLIEKMNNINISAAERREAVRLLGQTSDEKAVDALIDTLTDVQLRYDAVIALGKLGNSKSVKFLLATMFESESKVKMEIVKALRKIGDRKVVNPLLQIFRAESDMSVKSAIFLLAKEYGTFNEIFTIIPEALKTEPFEVRQLFLKYISENGDPRVCPLLYPLLFDENDKIKALAADTLWKFEGQSLLKRFNYVLLKTDNDDRRRDIAYICGELGVKDQVKPLIYVMVNEPRNVPLVNSIIEALHKIGDLSAFKPVKAFLKHPDKSVKMTAIRAMEGFSDPQVVAEIFNVVTDHDPEVKKVALQVLERLVTIEDVPEIKKYIGSEDFLIKVFVYNSLTRLDFKDEEIINQLIEDIENQDEKIRIEAIYTIGKLKILEGFDLVRSNLKSSNEDLRIAAARSLGFMEVRESVEELLSLLENESSIKVRATIVQVSGHLGTPGNKKVLDQVRFALKDEDPRVRSNAIEAMEMLGDEEIVDDIFPMLEDPNNRVKANAAKCLWKFGGIRMVSILENMLLKEKDKWQRASAAFAMGEMGTIQVIRPLVNALSDPEDCVRANAVKALGKTKSREVQGKLIPLLQDESDRVREETVSALGYVGGSVIINHLVKLITPGDSKMNELIFDAFMQAADVHFLVPMTKLVQEDSGPVKLIAARVLGSIGEDSTLPLLKELLNDGNVLIRTAAEDAINKISERVTQRKSEQIENNEEAENEVSEE